jgi:type IV secretion system protein VirB9
MKDGKPNLINFQVENGVYIVPQIIDSGYLAVGKKKSTFTRHDKSSARAIFERGKP